MANWKKWYRVDNVPLKWKIPYWIYSYVCGFFIWFYGRLCHYTCRIEVKNRERLDQGASYIMALWHENVWMVWVTFPPWKGHVWMNHPLWYMRPIHLALYWDGVE